MQYNIIQYNAIINRTEKANTNKFISRKNREKSQQDNQKKNDRH